MPSYVRAGIRKCARIRALSFEILNLQLCVFSYCLVGIGSLRYGPVPLLLDEFIIAAS